MSYYSMPIYGPVTSDGKQSLSVYENDGAGHTYITDKTKVDEFKKMHDKSVSNGRKSLIGFLGSFVASMATYSEKANTRTLGWIGVGIGMLYGAYKLISAFMDTKAAEKVLNDIKNNNNIKAENVVKKEDAPVKKDEEITAKQEEATKV